MERLWLRAREGTLRVGDTAPAFDLATFDKRSRVSLASLRGKPAVLVFGSYT
jgi:peroxiredoxin